MIPNYEWDNHGVLAKGTHVPAKIIMKLSLCRTRRSTRTLLSVNLPILPASSLDGRWRMSRMLNRLIELCELHYLASTLSQ